MLLGVDERIKSIGLDRSQDKEVRRLINDILQAIIKARVQATGNEVRQLDVLIELRDYLEKELEEDG
jgi:hypothetical protein